MAEAKTEAIGIKSNAGSVKSGTLFSEVLSSGDRVARAGKVLAICWGLAGITLFIPIAHFFLVPSFLVLGPVLAFMKYRAEEVVDHAEGECPECGEQVSIKLEPNDKLPKWSYCPACNKPLQLVYHSEASE